MIDSAVLQLVIFQRCIRGLILILLKQQIGRPLQASTYTAWRMYRSNSLTLVMFHVDPNARKRKQKKHLSYICSTGVRSAATATPPAGHRWAPRRRRWGGQGMPATPAEWLHAPAAPPGRRDETRPAAPFFDFCPFFPAHLFATASQRFDRCTARATQKEPFLPDVSRHAGRTGRRRTSRQEGRWRAARHRDWRPGAWRGCWRRSGQPRMTAGRTTVVRGRTCRPHGWAMATLGPCSGRAVASWPQRPLASMPRTVRWQRRDHTSSG